MTVISKILEHGVLKSSKIGWDRIILRRCLNIKYRTAPDYREPTCDELLEIEGQLEEEGIIINPISISKEKLDKFKGNFVFSSNYYSGKNTKKVIDEKILEHFIAYKFCEIESFAEEDIYIDVAGSSSPWAKMLREKGYKAYTIDLNKNKKFENFDYYLQENATKTHFEDSSVRACSLQCAFEMLINDDDWLFLDECKRILRPDGKVVISPLYMHTHHCGYSSPEYYKKGYSDIEAKEYIRKNSWGISFSRKYSAALLKKRIINHIERLGMKYKLYKLTNKKELGRDIYCHYILVITKI